MKKNEFRQAYLLSAPLRYIVTCCAVTNLKALTQHRKLYKDCGLIGPEIKETDDPRGLVIHLHLKQPYAENANAPETYQGVRVYVYSEVTGTGVRALT